jgi:heme-degrading monooxygenase HmoA
MFMRFVRVEVEQEKIPDFRQFYKDRILPALKETDGCLFATLVQQTVRAEDFISLTLWDSPGAAEAYEQSGLFQKLTDEAGPFLSSSVEWKVRLSKKLAYEYEGKTQGPLVEAFRVKSGDRKSLPDKEQTSRLYVRLVEAKVKQGKTKELEERYRDEILPALQSVEGFRGGFLVEGFQNPGDWISITIWDREEDAIRYELSGIFEELAGKVSDLLSSTHQWRMSLTSSGSEDKAASDDLTVTGYQVVTGKKM